MARLCVLLKWQLWQRASPDASVLQSCVRRHYAQSWSDCKIFICEHDSRQPGGGFSVLAKVASLDAAYRLVELWQAFTARSQCPAQARPIRRTVCGRNEEMCWRRLAGGYDLQQTGTIGVHESERNL